MTYPDRNKAEILLALHKVLRVRPKDSVPHPGDLARAMSKRDVKYTKEALLSLVKEDIEYKHAKRKEQIFSISAVPGYVSISLTNHGYSITPSLSYFYLLKTDLTNQAQQGTQDTSEFEPHTTLSGAKKSRDIRGQLSRMDPYKFENLVERVLYAMGVEKLITTQQSRDSGIDVRGTLILENVVHIKIAVQVKRYEAPVGSSDVQKLRGSLSSGEIGWFVTLSRFTPAAVSEADAPQRQPISLIDGETLIRLIEKYGIEVR